MPEARIVLDPVERVILTISTLAGKHDWRGVPAILMALDTRNPSFHANVQVLEEVEYRYEIRGFTSPIGRAEPGEIFDPDSAGANAGRLKPRRYTGAVDLEFFDEADNLLWRAPIEVRSRKLGYQTEYRAMLSRIAEEASELIMRRFAAGQQTFGSAVTGSPHTVYQRFAFIQTMLGSESFNAAIQLVLHRPHTQYTTIDEIVDPAKGLRGGSVLSRAITRAGPRYVLPAGVTVAGIETLPRTLTRPRHVETVDSIPNQFVKYALQTWLALAGEVERAMVRAQQGERRDPAAARGVIEANQLQRQLEATLASPPFPEIGTLESFPAGDQVLQRSEGYRQIFRTFLLADVAANLEWPGADDVFRAGQRDVATLYEYWVFFELARIVSEILDVPFDTSNLIKATSDGMALNLKKPRGAMLDGHVSRRGRVVRLRLWFNKTFSRDGGSWTEEVRPDCSLQIIPEAAGDLVEETWVHFDAKYRVRYRDIFREDSQGEQDNDTARNDAPMSDDLLKMHAYRDAVRRSAGAFVLYPGEDTGEIVAMRKYHELLPGLGAFILRPDGDGRAAQVGAAAVREFIEDVVDHVAARGTDRERNRFWEASTYVDWKHRDERRTEVLGTLGKPPADTHVLLGYVKDGEHLAWVLKTGLYNLRADPDRNGSVSLSSPELGAEMLLLYNHEWVEPRLFRMPGDMYIRTAPELQATGYPQPGGDQYLCFGLGAEITSLPGRLVPMSSIVRIVREGRARPDWAAPKVVSLDRLAISTVHPRKEG